MAPKCFETFLSSRRAISAFASRRAAGRAPAAFDNRMSGISHDVERASIELQRLNAVNLLHVIQGDPAREQIISRWCSAPNRASSYFFQNKSVDSSRGRINLLGEANIDILNWTPPSRSRITFERNLDTLRMPRGQHSLAASRFLFLAYSCVAHGSAPGLAKHGMNDTLGHRYGLLREPGTPIKRGQKQTSSG